MNSHSPPPKPRLTLPVDRRLVLRGMAFGVAALFAPRVSAQNFLTMLDETPQMTEGPFYPDKLPLDTDNDLIIVNNNTTPAFGQITHLTGKVLSKSGSPVRNAIVEIWQVDGKGTYIHSADSARGTYDKNFQGYGRFMTDSQGRYYFRTLKPVPYPGRTPHIHMGVNLNGKRVLTTQLMIKGHAQNAGDHVLNGVRNAKQRAAIQVPFTPIPGSKLNELQANFDIVLGMTPELPDKIKGGIGPSEMKSGRGFGPGGPGGPGGRPPGPPPGNGMRGRPGQFGPPPNDPGKKRKAWF